MPSCNHSFSAIITVFPQSLEKQWTEAALYQIIIIIIIHYDLYAGNL
jgi:hypothetical protein